jgi:ribokinase
MAHPQLISLGSINMDIQVRADRWPESGETLLATDFLMTCGGKAANVAVLNRKLGVETLLLGQVGDDILGNDILRQLKEAGIDLDHVRQMPDTATAVSTIVVMPDGEKTIILAANANLAWDEARDATRIAELIAAAPDGSVLVADLEVPVAIVRTAIRAAHERSLPVVLDPSPADRFTDDLCQYIDVLTPNTAEASQLTGIEIDSEEAARRAGRDLVERGIGAACQKLAQGGCVTVTQDSVLRIEPVPVDVVDQTGAGDAFAGGMGYGLLQGEDIATATLIAVASSHVAVTANGSQQSYPSSKELAQMTQRLRERNSNNRVSE